MATKKLAIDTDMFGSIDFTIEYEYSPFRPGRYSGPPEDCYPDEPEELEINAISAEHGALRTCDLHAELTESFIEYLHDELLEAIHDDYEPIDESDICVDYDPEDVV